MQRPPGRPWIIAHRGASAALHENTVAAFREAARRGADAVEFDVRRTADDVLVVHHGDRVPDVGPIVDLDAEELHLRAPWVPTFDQAMTACDGLWVNVEVKNAPTDRDWDPSNAIIGHLLDRIGSGGNAGRVLLSSFNPEAVALAAGRLPGLQTGLLIGGGLDPLEMISGAARAGHATIHPDVSCLRGERAGEIVAAAERHRLGVIAWTVDDPAEMRRLASTGVTGIITNVPDVARAALDG